MYKRQVIRAAENAVNRGRFSRCQANGSVAVYEGDEGAAPRHRVGSVDIAAIGVAQEDGEAERTVRFGRVAGHRLTHGEVARVAGVGEDRLRLSLIHI